MIRMTYLICFITACIGWGCVSDDSKEVIAYLNGRLVKIRDEVKKQEYDKARDLIRETIKTRGDFPQFDTLRMLQVQIDSLQKQKEIARKTAAEPLKKKMRYEKDEMTGEQYYTPVSAPKFVNRNGIYPIIQINSDSSTSMFLRIQYYADDWLFIQHYIVKADTTVFDLYPLSDVKTDVGDGGMIWEYTTMAATGQTLEMMQAVAKSKTAKIRFVGRQYYKEKPITEDQKQGFRDCIALFDAL